MKETECSKFDEWVQMGVLTLYKMSIENVSKINPFDNTRCDLMSMFQLK